MCADAEKGERMAKRRIQTKEDIGIDLAITDDKELVTNSTMCKLGFLSQREKKKSGIMMPPVEVRNAG